LSALCHRFSIPYTEVRSSDTGAVLGYGLCVDSLRKARFNAQNWQNGVVLIDECEQCSGTLSTQARQRGNRSYSQELKTLLGNVLQGSGRVFLADADLRFEHRLGERSGAAGAVGSGG